RDGWHLDHGLVTKIRNWGPLANVSEVRQFLGTVGVGRKWIKGFAIVAKPLTSLLRGSDADFLFDEEALDSQTRLKELATTAPVLSIVDYALAKLITPPPRDSDHGLVVL